MRDCFQKTDAVWAKQQSAIAKAEDRIPPLNILAVLGMDVAARDWKLLASAHSNISSDQVKALLSQTDICVAYQEEVKALLPNTQWKDSFRFDIQYDLTRLYCLRYQMAKASNLPQSSGYWAVAALAMKDALAGPITAQQRDGVHTDLAGDQRTGFQGLTDSELAELRQLAQH
jgi:hypothetical protein